MRAGLLDRSLDFMVLPGYSRIGFALRGLRRMSFGRGHSRTASSSSPAGAPVSGRRPARGLWPPVHGFTCSFGTLIAARTPIRRIESRLPRARGAIELELCDLSDLTEVRRFAEGFQARNERLDLLVNNAGVLPPERTHTADGVELTFATNVLGPFLLTSLLLPVLLAGASSRVITVSSGGMYTARLDAEDPQLERRSYDGPRFYAHAKRAQVALNHVWAEQFPAERIAFHAMHPGWVDTPGLRSSLPRFRQLMRPLLRDASPGRRHDRLARHATDA